jgi:hypothetical protein
LQYVLNRIKVSCSLVVDLATVSNWEQRRKKNNHALSVSQHYTHEWMAITLIFFLIMNSKSFSSSVWRRELKSSSIRETIINFLMEFPLFLLQCLLFQISRRLPAAPFQHLYILTFFTIIRRRIVYEYTSCNVYLLLMKI